MTPKSLPAPSWSSILGHSLVIGIWSLVILLSACSVGPDYRRPNTNTSDAFRGAPSSVGSNSLGELPWWEVFKDETLQSLVRAALTNSYDLRIAITRVEQARAIAAQNRAVFFPQLDYQGSLGRGKNAFPMTALPTGGHTIDLIVAEGNVSWEIDLWGRIRRLNEAARAQFLASEEARRGVILLVISEVAQAYFQLLALDRQMEIANRTTNSFTESWRIFSERLERGVVSKLETSAAEALLASAAATVPELERQMVVQENLISVLLGHNPGPITRSRNWAQEQLGPDVPAGLPSALLERRPDVREAEQNLRSVNAQLGVAKANFFPKLSLTALLGKVSPELSAFTAGSANAWSAAANLTGPLFHGGSLRAQYQQTLAEREQFRLQYQAIVLTALEEVSNALIARQKYAAARTQQARAVQAYRAAVEVSMERYVAGRAGYYEVLLQQQLLFPAENSLVQTELNQMLALIQLYRALGGGWIVPEPTAD